MNNLTMEPAIGKETILGLVQENTSTLLDIKVMVNEVKALIKDSQRTTETSSGGVHNNGPLGLFDINKGQQKILNEIKCDLLDVLNALR